MAAVACSPITGASGAKKARVGRLVGHGPPAQSKSSPSGPLTGADAAGRAKAAPSAISMVSNLPLGSAVFIQRFCTGSPGPRQHPFGSGKCPYPDGYAGRPTESPIVCPGFPFPFGFRRWLLGPSCSRWGVEPSLRSADRAKAARTEPAASQRLAMHPTHAFHLRDLGSRGIIGSSCSSPVRPLRFAPRRYRNRTSRAGTGHTDTYPLLHLQLHQLLSNRSVHSNSCNFVSHGRPPNDRQPGGPWLRPGAG